MKRSLTFFILCLCFIAGIGVHSILFPYKNIIDSFSWYVIFLALLASSILVWSLHAKKIYIIVIIFVGFFALGLFRFSLTIPDIDENNILYYKSQEVSLYGVVDSFPRESEKVVSYIIDLQEVREGNKATKLKGSKLLLTLNNSFRYDYGDLLAFVCEPGQLNEYEQYARREKAISSCAFPDYATIISHNNGSSIKTTLFSIRETFNKRLELLFSNPYGGLLAGLLYGDTSGFSKESKQVFRITGLSHITALSGYNVTILAMMLISFFVFLLLTRKQSLPISFLLILSFVVLTGAEASVIRAAIMGFLIMGAKGIGRMSKIHISLAFAGAIMLLINPYLLRFDLGFQLSFLATIALVWMADDVGQYTWIKRLPTVFGIKEAAAASAAAIIFTAPMLFYTVGMLGPLSLIVNIIVIPIVPFAMALGFIAVIMDFIFHPIGIMLSLIAQAPLIYIIAVAKYFAKFGAIEFKIGAFSALVLSGIIVLAIMKWKKNIKKEYV